MNFCQCWNYLSPLIHCLCFPDGDHSSVCETALLTILSIQEKLCSTAAITQQKRNTHCNLENVWDFFPPFGNTFGKGGYRQVEHFSQQSHFSIYPHVTLAFFRKKNDNITRYTKYQASRVNSIKKCSFCIYLMGS